MCRFGTLGAGDVDLLKRIIAALGNMRYRALVNVGGYKGAGVCLASFSYV